jgi:hypothetical protein
MTIDAALLREAREVLQLYSTPAQELIKQNLYGPREARLAGAIVANSLTVVSYQEPTETELLATWKSHAWEQISMLCNLLQQTAAIIEERVAGHEALLRECDIEISTAEENFVVDAKDEENDEAPEHADNVFVVVFPPLDPPLADGFVNDFVDKLKCRGVHVWVADESDYTRRVKAMTMREIYNVGRVASVVVTNREGVVLDGWYSGMPWIEEVIAKVAELRT